MLEDDIDGCMKEEEVFLEDNSEENMGDLVPLFSKKTFF